jgi:hypothetical protein
VPLLLYDCVEQPLRPGLAIAHMRSLMQVRSMGLLAAYTDDLSPGDPLRGVSGYRA